VPDIVDGGDVHGEGGSQGGARGVERVGGVCGDEEFMVRIIEITVKDPSGEEGRGRSEGGGRSDKDLAIML
jgi:hypothetical protein